MLERDDGKIKKGREKGEMKSDQESALVTRARRASHSSTACVLLLLLLLQHEMQKEYGRSRGKEAWRERERESKQNKETGNTHKLNFQAHTHTQTLHAQAQAERQACRECVSVSPSICAFFLRLSLSPCLSLSPFALVIGRRVACSVTHNVTQTGNVMHAGKGCDCEKEEYDADRRTALQH